MVLQLAEATRADTLRATLDSVFAGAAYRWDTRADPFGPLRRLWLSIGDVLTRLRDQNPEAFRLFTWALLAVLVLILAHAAWVTVRTVRGGSRQEQRTAALPAVVTRDAAWYAAEAARLAQGGDLAAAMQADFLRLVLELDARRVMRFHPSKTPSEYTRDPALGDEGRRQMRELVSAMYAHAFARAPVDHALYERWRALAVADRYAPAI